MNKRGGLAELLILRGLDVDPVAYRNVTLRETDIATNILDSLTSIE